MVVTMEPQMLEDAPKVMFLSGKHNHQEQLMRSGNSWSPIGRTGRLLRGRAVAGRQALFPGLCKGPQFPEAGPLTPHGYFSLTRSLSLDLTLKEWFFLLRLLVLQTK